MYTYTYTYTYINKYLYGSATNCDGNIITKGMKEDARVVFCQEFSKVSSTVILHSQLTIELSSSKFLAAVSPTLAAAHSSTKCSILKHAN